jgi:hypothetical protein
VHKHAVLHLRQRRPKVLVELVQVAEPRKPVAGAEALRLTLLQPVRRT